MSTTDVQAAIAAAVEARADEAAELLSQSIRRASVTGHEDEFASFIGAWCRQQGFTVEQQALRDSDLDRAGGLRDEERIDARHNLLVRPWRDHRGPRLVVNGHLDVVPPGQDSAWQGDPFDGRRQDGVVHGRGAVDTKGGIVAALTALASLRDAGMRPAVDVEVHLVVGEERSGVGTRVALAGSPRPDMAIVLEATDNRVVTASTGLVAFDISVVGQAAHTSSPWKGRDALRHLMAVHHRIDEREARRNERFHYAEFADVPVPLPFAVGLFSAGTYRSAVPESAEMAGRLGLAPGEAVADAVDSLRQLVRATDAAAGWSPPTIVDVAHALAGWRTDPTHPLAVAMTQAVRHAGGDGPLAMTAGSDAGYYGELGIPTVMFGPGDMALAHSPDERLSEGELVRAASILAGTLVAVDA